MEQASTETRQRPPTRTLEEEALFFGEMSIEYAEQGPEAGENEGPAGGQTLPLGIGTEGQLIGWARGLRTDDDLFPAGEIINGVWITLLPTVNGRIPWERGEEVDAAPFLLLEGMIPEYVLEDYDEDIVIKRVPSVISH